MNLLRLCLLLSPLVTVLGCGGPSTPTPTQAVAKVNKQEITELQLNQVLERQTGIKPDQIDATQRKVLTALVDQQMLVEKAQELKIDRDQRVVQAIEASKRDLIARAYLDRIGEGAAKPTAAEVQQYYLSKPALFKERRIYSFQELNVEAKPEQRADIEAQLKILKSTAELEAYIRGKQIPVRSEQSTVAAENLPMPLLDRLSAMKRGQGLVLPTATGLRIVVIGNIQEVPVAEEQARPAIQAFLLNEQKRKTIEKELASLRTATKVEYFGKFAGMAASAASGVSAPSATAASAANSATSDAARAPATTVATEAARAGSPAASSAGSGLDAASMSKAISGLK